jgi:hypothetical protein
MNEYSKALVFATKAHLGQKRANGDNYIIHPIRVSQEVKTIPQKICALLHDVVEDTDTSLSDIVREFGSDIATKIDILTHRKGESYEDYISRVLEDPDTVAVKIADICDNLGDSPSDHAIQKCSRSLSRLVGNTDASGRTCPCGRSVPESGEWVCECGMAGGPGRGSETGFVTIVTKPITTSPV